MLKCVKMRLMIASGHNSAGTILGILAYKASVSSSNPWYMICALLVIAGIAVHYLTDALPHGHYNWQIVARDGNKRFNKALIPAMLLDGLGSFIALAAITNLVIGHNSLWYVILGVMASQLPDFIMLANKIGLGSNNKLVIAEQSFHGGIVHWHDLPNDTPRPWSWTDLWQVLVFIIAVLSIFALK